MQDQQCLFPISLNSTAMATNFDGLFQGQRFNQQIIGLPPVYSPEATIDIQSPVPVESTQVKMGLKEKIKTKYNGTEMPQIEMKKAEPPKPRVKEDPEVLKRRRERNKIAATKCRKRKRERIEKLQQRTNKIQSEKRKLEEEKKQLLKELHDLRLVFNNHNCKKRQLESNPDCATYAEQSEFLNLFNETFMAGNTSLERLT